MLRTMEQLATSNLAPGIVTDRLPATLTWPTVARPPDPGLPVATTGVQIDMICVPQAPSSEDPVFAQIGGSASVLPDLDRHSA